MSGAKDLFRALELAHYAERFRDKLFVIGLPAEIPFQELLLDFKVLAGYHIQVALVLPDPAFQLEKLVAESNHRGTRFHLSLLTELLLDPPWGIPDLDFDRIREVLGQGKIPIIAYQPDPSTSSDSEVDLTFHLAATVALRLGADKLFLVTALAGTIRRVHARSHVLSTEMEELRSFLAGRGIAGHDALFDFIGDHLEGGIPDIILIEGKPTNIFREVFTHDGAGILFNRIERSQVRQAHLRDITDIGLLLRPEITAGRILPTSESQIEANIGAYWVYDIDGLLVGAARLKIFGESAELAQFATLPRYRGKGRARDLALRLIDEARALGLERVFALSTDKRMWEFFLSLGFFEVERESLPPEWQAQYDKARRSSAFQLQL